MKIALFELGWASKYQFKELAWIMVDADLESLELPSPGEEKKILEEPFDGWRYWKGNPIELMERE